MLGDSYTSANNGLDTILAKLLKGADDDSEVKAVTDGGKDFQYMAKMLKTPGSAQEQMLKAENADRSLPDWKTWGFVVLQDRSHVPAFCCNGPKTDYYNDFNHSLAAVKELDKAAEAHDAQTLLLQTWGRRDGVPEPFLKNFEAFNERVIQGYAKYAREITRNDRTPLIAPVGEAFSLLYNDVEAAKVQANKTKMAPSTENLWRSLYSEDGSHPSPAGSYLTACVIYATIARKSPIGLLGISGISDADIKALQQTADKAVFGDPIISDEFRMMEGSYNSQDPHNPGYVADIKDGCVVWPVGIPWIRDTVDWVVGVRTPLRKNYIWQDMTGHDFLIFFHGTELTGTYVDGSIVWSDGDLWKRSIKGGEPGKHPAADTERPAGDTAPPTPHVESEPQQTVLVKDSKTLPKQLARREPAVVRHAQTNS